MEHKIYKSRIEDVGTKGEVVIAINAFGNVDAQKDRSLEGSFDKTIKENVDNIFWYKNHDSNDVLGVAAKFWPDGKYLNAQAKFNLEKQFARDMYSDYKFFQENGRTIKHSVGVTALNWKMDKDIRDVSEWKLWEFSSLTKWPANNDTPTHSIKSLDEVELDEIFNNIEMYFEWIAKKGIHTDEHIRRIENIKNLILNRPLDAPDNNEPLNALIDINIQTIKAPDRGEPNNLQAKMDFDKLINNFKF